MPEYAITQFNEVVNIVVGESQEIVEQVTGLSAVERNEHGAPGMGWVRSELGWESPHPPPFPSWTWDYESLLYVAPVLMPDGDPDSFSWSEDMQSWLPVEA